ncbi:MAG: hypothetical protein AAF502_22010 [Bacteroidota bacterium]
MKTLVFSCCIIFLASLPTTVFSQDQPTRMDRTIQLDGKDHSENIVINVEQGASKLKIELNGTIEGGEVMLVVYNPNGEKVNNMCLKAGKGKKAKGIMVESHTSPDPGIWNVKINSDTASGKITYTIRQN